MSEALHDRYPPLPLSPTATLDPFEKERVLLRRNRRGEKLDGVTSGIHHRSEAIEVLYLIRVGWSSDNSGKT
jgi:hypothetical protein